ncbi:MAG: hypothetical protein II857_09325 [Selenomonadaceae bacterium]|nr:hypothetical protein [Selenomonadaceae bacterium]MBQ4404596.1 hypothetical protein [Selenomonadaceae bacterium]
MTVKHTIENFPADVRFRRRRADKFDLGAHNCPSRQEGLDDGQLSYMVLLMTMEALGLKSDCAHSDAGTKRRQKNFAAHH